jgi:hypothetical protein
MGINTFARAQDMKLGRSQADTVSQALHDGHLSVFHAWRDFREEDIAVTKMRIALLHFFVAPHCACVDASTCGLDSRHWYECHFRIVSEKAAIGLRVNLDSFAQWHCRPAN